tara:strand:- start:186 stop:338 length:153 start_codon:yes stop_codon:yes gene_type:complete
MNRYDELTPEQRIAIDRLINAMASGRVRFTRGELAALAFPDSHAHSHPGV